MTEHLATKAAVDVHLEIVLPGRARCALGLVEFSLKGRALLLLHPTVDGFAGESGDEKVAPLGD